MSALTVRNLPDETHRALKLRAAQHGRSTEAEVRHILENAVCPKVGMGAALSAVGLSLGALSWLCSATPARCVPRSSSDDYSGHERRLGTAQTGTITGRSRLA